MTMWLLDVTGRPAKAGRVNSTEFAIIFGPIIGLVGTVLGLWLGQRQWRQERTDREKGQFDGKLKDAYYELWFVVEYAHLRMRDSLSGISAENFSGHLADVNNFMIKHGLYIERDDRYLVLQYLFWTNEYLRRLAIEPRGAQYILASLTHDGLSTKIDLLGEVQSQAEVLRNELRQRVRAVVGAPKSDAWCQDHRPSRDLIAQLDDLTARAVRERQAGASSILFPDLEPGVRGASLEPDDLGLHDDDWI
jgi:hypothetical protein